LEKTGKIRILIGIGTDRRTVDSVQNSNQREFQYSHAEVKEHYSDEVKDELENSDDSDNAEEGVYKFIEWLRSKRVDLSLSDFVTGAALEASSFILEENDR